MRKGPGYKPPPVHSHELAPLSTPVRILEKLSPVSYRIELPQNSRIHDVVLIIHLWPFEGDPGELRPLPILDDQGLKTYEVERIVGERKRRGKGKIQMEYLVQWKGYTADERTWEPVSHLDGAREALDEWMKKKEESCDWWARAIEDCWFFVSISISLFSIFIFFFWFHSRLEKFMLSEGHIL